MTFTTVSNQGVLAGTPTATASASITFTATNALGADSRALTLTVAAASSPAVSNPVTYAVTATGTGTTYNVYSDTDMDNVPWGALGAGDAVNIYWKSTPYTRKWGTGRNLDRLGTQTNPIVINGVTDASGNRPRFNWDGGVTAKGSNPSLLSAWVAANPGVTPSTKYDSFLQGDVNNGEKLAGIWIYGGFASKPSFFQIKNLEVYGTRGNTAIAQPAGSFTNLSGSVENYAFRILDFRAGIYDGDRAYEASGIRFQSGADGLVENCVIRDCGWGVFTQISSKTINSIFERFTMRNCRLSLCGNPGADTEHNAYVQCINPVIEGNYFGKLINDAKGSSYKSRSGGGVFRYNWVEGNARALDFVEPEEQGPFDDSTPGYVGSSDMISLADFGVDHVYGNVICIDRALMGPGDFTNQLHFGGDKNNEQASIPYATPYDPLARAALFQSPKVGGKKLYPQRLFFYNNTYVLIGMSRLNFFDVSDSGATVEMWNNLFFTTSNNQAGYLSGWANVAKIGGNFVYHGLTNVMYSDKTSTPPARINHGELFGYGSSYIDPSKTSVNGQTGVQILAGSANAADLYDADRNAAWIGNSPTSNPQLTNIAAYNFQPTVGGSATGAGTVSFPAAVGAGFKSLPVQFQPVTRSNGMIARTSLTTIGAIQ
jgi:hypothetical protein